MRYGIWAIKRSVAIIEDTVDKADEELCRLEASIIRLPLCLPLAQSPFRRLVLRC